MTVRLSRKAAAPAADDVWPAMTDVESSAAECPFIEVALGSALGSALKSASRLASRSLRRAHHTIVCASEHAVGTVAWTSNDSDCATGVVSDQIDRVNPLIESILASIQLILHAQVPLALTRGCNTHTIVQKRNKYKCLFTITMKGLIRSISMQRIDSPRAHSCLNLRSQ